MVGTTETCESKASARQSEEEWVLLSGGMKPVLDRAAELSSKGEHRLACHLVETAFQAQPKNLQVHSLREQVYRERRKCELSLMARGIYGAVERESHAIVDPQNPLPSVPIFTNLGS